MVVIDLDIMTGYGKVHNLGGKERGLQARANFGLDALDAGDDTVTVVVPGHVYAMSTGFFLGMFSQSVNKLGPEVFARRYLFCATDSVMDCIEHAMARLRSDRGPLTA